MSEGNPAPGFYAEFLIFPPFQDSPYFIRARKFVVEVSRGFAWQCGYKIFKKFNGEVLPSLSDPHIAMSKRVPTSAQDVTGTEKAAKLTEVNCNRDASFSNGTKQEGFAPQTPAKTAKRTDYLSWDEYFMAVAFLSAQRSKDPSSQVGACVVNQEKKIVGIGYNGMPNGCSDDELPWARHASNELETKYPYGKMDYLIYKLIGIAKVLIHWLSIFFSLYIEESFIALFNSYLKSLF